MSWALTFFLIGFILPNLLLSHAVVGVRNQTAVFKSSGLAKEEYNEISWYICKFQSLFFWISFHYERTREQKQRLFGLSNSLLENWRVELSSRNDDGCFKQKNLSSWFRLVHLSILYRYRVVNVFPFYLIWRIFFFMIKHYLLCCLFCITRFYI